MDIHATTVVTPTDRIRWSSVLGGLFAALSALAVLATLGSAIGASAYDPGDSARNFGIGAGIWGIVSALLAFALGGWVAARSAAVAGRNNGLLNGAMVWAVAIPVMAYVVAGLVGRTAATAADVAGNAAQAAATTEDVGDRAQTASARIGDRLGNINGERAADNTARAGWTTLAGLLLSLGAA
ncbi:MAG TPA: hypothetical protein VK324_09815, partial [Tepidisphaeraceae bacterium]|nr:hypothetical protein [Tepidisphaeraceae bacterium]